MEKESKQPKLGTPEAKRELDALHKLMRRYTAGGDLTVEELHLLDKVAVSNERTSPGKEPETKNAGRRILRRVYAATVPHDGRQTAAVRKIRPVSRLYRYGAVATFLLLVGVSAVIGFRALERTPQLVELAALQEVEEFTLPDGSRIYLNRGSKLTYDDRTFNDERREIRLSGEAFFEVAKNPAKPFIVYGGQTQTTVRGTSFNVKAYPGVRENVISVRDGRVEVKNAEHEVLAVLTRNRQITWDTATQTARQDSIAWQRAAGWKDGRMLVLNHAGLDEIKLKMEQCYGVSMTIDRITDGQVSFYGSYPLDDGGAALLKELSCIYGIHSKGQDNRIELYR